jgi:hypothetical protein
MKAPLFKEIEHPKLLVLACTVIEQEIQKFQNGRVELKFFDYGLHRTPENMARALQVEIDRVSEEDWDGIILGYGLCSNGVVGLCARKQPLIVPRVHDCITLFLGSPERYRHEATRHPGTYYLTPGWIEKGETPISKYHSYARSYGEETARWVLYEEMKNYTQIMLINTGPYEIERYRKIARLNAEFLGISYQELQGCYDLFKEMVFGPWGKDFLIVEKGDSIKQEMFFDL